MVRAAGALGSLVFYDYILVLLSILSLLFLDVNCFFFQMGRMKWKCRIERMK